MGKTEWIIVVLVVGLMAGVAWIRRLLLAAVAAFCVAGRLAGSALRYYRHFLAGLANCAVCAVGGRLLVTYIAAFPPLAQRAPLFRPDGAQLGAQTGHSA